MSRGRKKEHGSDHFPTRLCLLCRSSTFIKNQQHNKLQESILFKNKRCFKFLSERLGVKEPEPNGFNFIYIGKPPLCANCNESFNKLDALQLKLKAIELQIGMELDEIKSNICKSYKEAENKREAGDLQVLDIILAKSHFDLFREQVVFQKDAQFHQSIPHLNIKLTRLTPEEIQSHCLRNKYELPDALKIESEFEAEDSYEVDLPFLETDDLMVESSQSALSQDSLIFTTESVQNVQDSQDAIIRSDPIEMEKIFSTVLHEDQSQLKNGEQVVVTIDQQKVHCSVLVKSIKSKIPLSESSTKGYLQSEEDLSTIIQVRDLDEIIEEEENICDTNKDEESSNTINDSNQNNPTESSSKQTIIFDKELLIIPKLSPKPKRVFPKTIGEDNCSLCGQENKSEQELLRHFKSNHPGLKPFKCTEPLCEYSAFQRKIIRKHIFINHTPAEEKEKAKRHVCKFCGKKYSHPKGLRYHLSAHANIKPFQCEYCAKSFRQMQALKMHINDIHERNVLFKCPHCPKEFTRKTILEFHVRAHTGDRNLVCHICGQRKIQLSSLKSHFKVHIKRGDWVEPPEKRIKYKRRKKEIDQNI